jgi:hypothetical protein
MKLKNETAFSNQHGYYTIKNHSPFEDWTRGGNKRLGEGERGDTKQS